MGRRLLLATALVMCAVVVCAALVCFVPSNDGAQHTFSDAEGTFSYEGLKYQINEDGNTVTVIEPDTHTSGDLKIPNAVKKDGKTYQVTAVGESAFEGCSGFTGSLIIPDSVTSIGNLAFSGCSGFTGSLIIPDSVTSIGKSAFFCSGFTGSLTIGKSVTSIEDSAFFRCSGFTGSLIIPDSVTSIGESAFNECKGFTGSLIIPDGVTSIGKSAFQNCSGLTGSLIIGKSVTYIGYGAFQNCSGLTGSLTIPDSVTSIDNLAFYNCSGLTGDLTIPDSITSINYGVFDNCSGFTGSLTIPDSVTSIDEIAFYGCTGITKISIGKNATALSDSFPWKFYDYGKEIGLDKIQGKNFEKYDKNNMVCYYMITVNEMNGSDIVTETKYGKFNLPAEPSNEGYRFFGWSDGELFYNAGDEYEPKKDVTICAMWYKIESGYTASFNLDGGGGYIAPIVGTDITLPKVPQNKTGYTFLGWSDGTKIYGAEESYQLTENVMFTAVWKPNQYTVKFDANSGSGSMTSETFDYGEDKALTENSFAKEGFKFIGWGIDKDSKIVKYADREVVRNLAESGTLTLYAIWGLVLEADSDSVKKGETLGMSISFGSVGGITVDDSGSAEKILSPDEYEIVQTNGGSAITILGKCTEKLSTGNCIFRVYTANGGAIDGIAEGTVRVTDSRPDPPVPPEPTPTYYEVSYDIAGGSEPGPGTMLYKEGDTAEVAPYNGHKDEYYFDGWSCNGKTYKTGDEFVVSGNMKFTAIWVSNSNPAPEPSEDNTVMVVGVVGVIAAVALIGGAAYFIRRR